MPAMPLSLVDAADDARADLFLAWDVAAAVVDAVPGEAALEFEEFQWAWASVRSRAITFRVAQREGAGSGDGSGDESGNAAETRSLERRSLEKDRANEADASRKVASRRCLVPVVDMMNHACAAFEGSAASEAAFPGPAVTAAPTMNREENAVAWRAARSVKKGEEVTWTYGADLTNEHLWLHYGFVPDPPVHAGCAVTFSFPAHALLDGIRAVASEDDEATSLKRFALLEKCGLAASSGLPGDSPSPDVSYPASGDARRGEGEREIAHVAFTVTLGERPGALAGIAGVACCAPEEARAMHEGVFSSSSTKEKAETKSNRACVSLCPESRRRAREARRVPPGARRADGDGRRCRGGSGRRPDARNRSGASGSRNGAGGGDARARGRAGDVPVARARAGKRGAARGWRVDRKRRRRRCASLRRA